MRQIFKQKSQESKKLLLGHILSPKSILHDDRGVVFLWVIIAMLVISITGGIVLSVALSDSELSGYLSGKEQVQYLAQAGSRMVEQKMLESNSMVSTTSFEINTNNIKGTIQIKNEEGISLIKNNSVLAHVVTMTAIATMTGQGIKTDEKTKGTIVTNWYYYDNPINYFQGLFLTPTSSATLTNIENGINCNISGEPRYYLPDTIESPDIRWSNKITPEAVNVPELNGLVQPQFQPQFTGERSGNTFLGGAFSSGLNYTAVKADKITMGGPTPGTLTISAVNNHINAYSSGTKEIADTMTVVVEDIILNNYISVAGGGTAVIYVNNTAEIGTTAEGGINEAGLSGGQLFLIGAKDAKITLGPYARLNAFIYAPEANIIIKNEDSNGVFVTEGAFINGSITGNITIPSPNGKFTFNYKQPDLMRLHILKDSNLENFNFSKFREYIRIN